MTADAVGVSSGSTLHFTYTKQWYDSDNDFSPAARDDRDFDLADIYTTYSYEYWDGAQQKNISLSNRDGTSVSSYTYDKLGRISSVNVGGPRAHTVNYTVDAAGQVISRYVTGGPNGQSPKQYYSYFNGIQIGSNGNNGNDNPDIATAIKEKAAEGPDEPGIFRNGATSGSNYANFDRSYDPINAGDPGSTAGTYTVRAGESLQSIATAVWGDGSLWYMLAQANGLSGSSQLAAGQMLVIPNKVANFHNNANTFRTYDAARALGETQPSTPKPPKAKKCGVLGTIALIIVAAVVAYYVGPLVEGFVASLGVSAGVAQGIGLAAGAAAATATTQSLEVITGYRDKISWKQVALDGIEAGVSFGLTKVKFLNGGKGLGRVALKVVRAALANAITQGIGKATGLKDKFDWTGVAVAGATAVGSEIADKVKINSDLLKKLFKTTAGAIVGAATRSLIDGTNFGDNVLAALPSAIASVFADELIEMEFSGHNTN